MRRSAIVAVILVLVAVEGVLWSVHHHSLHDEGTWLRGLWYERRAQDAEPVVRARAIVAMCSEGSFDALHEHFTDWARGIGRGSAPDYADLLALAKAEFCEDQQVVYPDGDPRAGTTSTVRECSRCSFALERSQTSGGPGAIELATKGTAVWSAFLSAGEAVVPLLGDMTDPNAVRLLGYIGGDEAINCILGDAVNRPRIDTAIVLAALLDAGPRAVYQLVALASIGLGRHGDGRSSQVYAARGLLTSVARARLDLLTPYLHAHNDAGYRVADALGESHASGARAALEASLSDPDPVMRRVVASALGTLGERAAIPALRARVHDDDEWVRQSVGSALQKLEAIP